MGGARAPIALMNVGAAGQFFVRGCQHTLDEQPVIGLPRAAAAGPPRRAPAGAVGACPVQARPGVGVEWSRGRSSARLGNGGKSTKNCHILLPDDLGSDRHREVGDGVLLRRLFRVARVRRNSDGSSRAAGFFECSRVLAGRKEDCRGWPGSTDEE